MHSGRLYTLGLTLEVEKQEVHREASEHEQEDVQEFHLGVVNDGCQHQVEGHQEHDDRDEGGNLVSVVKIPCLYSQVQETGEGGSIGEPGQEAQEVHKGAEVSWDDQQQSHSRGEDQGWRWGKSMHMNHGHKLGHVAFSGRCIAHATAAEEPPIDSAKC